MSKLWLIYETWSKQENKNRLYRYKSNMYRYKLVKNDKIRNCTDTSSTCTGTSLRKMPRMCVFPIFHALSSMDHSYTSYTHQNHSKFALESLFYSIHLSITYLSSKFISRILPKKFLYALRPIHKPNMMFS